ncbi:MAG: ligase [Ktedonobacteraceae bacterium]|nr:ligase [Ktedonobacteraceae bacterium]
MSNWQIYALTIADQQQHIEQSETLLTTIRPQDPPILYWSQAETTALVLGFSQKRDVLNGHACNTIPVYHRRAGGTAVLVGPSLLSLDVVLPAGHPLILPDIVESYRWFGEAWTDALKLLGIEARIVPPAEAHNHRSLLKDPATRNYELLMQRACYGTLSSYEVAVGKRKVVGLDMIRRRSGTLLQAGVLLQWETSLLAELLGHTPQEQALLRTGLLERAIGIDTLAGRAVTAGEIIHAFETVLLL